MALAGVSPVRATDRAPNQVHGWGKGPGQASKNFTVAGCEPSCTQELEDGQQGTRAWDQGCQPHPCGRHLSACHGWPRAARGKGPPGSQAGGIGTPSTPAGCLDTSLHPAPLVGGGMSHSSEHGPPPAVCPSGSQPAPGSQGQPSPGAGGPVGNAGGDTVCATHRGPRSVLWPPPAQL